MYSIADKLSLTLSVAAIPLYSFSIVTVRLLLQFRLMNMKTDIRDILYWHTDIDRLVVGTYHRSAMDQPMVLRGNYT